MIKATKHGYGPYSRGCRCDVCRAAKAAYMSERRTKAWRQARLAADDGEKYIAPIARHGTRAGYEEHGCRCTRCAAARRAADQLYRKEKS